MLHQPIRCCGLALLMLVFLSGCNEQGPERSVEPEIIWAQAFPEKLFTMQDTTMKKHLSLIREWFSQSAWFTFLSLCPYKKAQKFVYRSELMGPVVLLEKTSYKNQPTWKFRQLLEISWPPYHPKDSEFIAMDFSVQKGQFGKFTVVRFSIDPKLPVK